MFLMLYVAETYIPQPTETPMEHRNDGLRQFPRFFWFHLLGALDVIFIDDSLHPRFREHKLGLLFFDNVGPKIQISSKNRVNKSQREV